MSGTSDESDHFGYAAEESDQDEWGSSAGGPGYLDVPPNPFEEIENRLIEKHLLEMQDKKHNKNRFLDIEAADSDDLGSDQDDSRSDASELHFFPQFKRLPFELRQQIWEFFCPDLAVKSRVYHFQLMTEKPEWQRSRKRESGGPEIWSGAFLEPQTRPARAMLAVHRESRQLALKAFPDLLLFERHGLVRFNSKSDVVLLHVQSHTDLSGLQLPADFSDRVQHLAVDSSLFGTVGNHLPEISAAFRNLKAVYNVRLAAEQKAKHLRWCTSNLVNRYSIATSEEQPGLGEDAEHVYCWPDLENHRSFAEKEIPANEMDFYLQEDERNARQIGDLKAWPLVHFLETRWYDKLRDWNGEGDMDFMSSDSDGDDEPDEYESDGIDDSDISEDGSEHDSDLIVLDHDGDSSGGGEEEEEEGSEEGSSAISGSSPAHHQVETIDLTGDDDHSVPRFSSPEESSRSSSTVRESGSDQQASRISRLKRPRGRVVDSDSDDDSEGDVPRKRARTSTIVISDDDDEEDEERKMRANARSRAVISEDEEEEEEERRKMPPNRRSRAVLSEDDDNDSDDSDDSEAGEAQEGGTGRGTEWSGISSSDEDEEPEGGAAIARPLSLADKLQLHRDKVPIPPSEDDDSDIEEMGGDDYDARQYADFQDDEEGNETSEEGDDDDDGLIMDEDGEDEDVEY